MEKWRTRFFSIWTGQSLSLVGSVAAQFALVWWITEKTGSATVLATAALVAMAPSIVLRPFIGVLVDRLSRKRVMMLSDSFIALVSLWLAYLFWTGAMEVWHVYVVMLARSFGGAFHHTAMMASMTLIVPKKHYARVEGLNQIIDGGLGVLGPMLGALLLMLLPLHGIMMLDFATAAFAVLPLFLFTIPQPEPIEGKEAERPHFWADFRAGFRYVAAWRGLIALCGLLVVLNFALSPAFSLTPILVLKGFGGDEVLLGSFNSAMGLGTVIGGLILSIWGGSRRKIFATLGAVTTMGGSLFLIAVAPSGLFYVAIAGFFLSGLLMAIGNGNLRAVFRGVVHPSMQGRVGALMGSLATAMSPIGLLIAGPVADAIGVRSWFAIAGSILVLGGIVGFGMPPLRNIEAEAEERRASHAGSLEKTDEAEAIASASSSNSP
ncbi:MFS transporter [Candidatus Bipolaricaulota bacterium]|nr:MFS transporter [Candidatus Bipolaricaulota bacterium]